jgi:hypothetical protein
MTQEDLLPRFCMMLAFQTILANGKKTETPDTAKRIMEFAKRMNEFCDLYVSKAFSPETEFFIDDKGAAKIDAAIAQHIEELRTKETTHLPEDKETLIQFYDRLQQRKSRRMQWQFYATATKEKLSDLILHYLDEEIEDMNLGARQ